MNFNQLRKSLNLTQVEVAEKMNINQTTISKWEKNKAIPSLETMKKLAETLQVDVNEILNCFIEKTKKEN